MAPSDAYVLAALLGTAFVMGDFFGVVIVVFFMFVLTHVLCDTIAEAIAATVKVQVEGSRVMIVDAQVFSVITAGYFDVREAEGYLDMTVEKRPRKVSDGLDRRLRFH